MIGIVNVVLGGALLIAGRKLFWLFVGALGFLTGVQLATQFWQGPEGAAIIVGLVVGIIFAMLAIFLQTIAIGVAGFFAGAYTLSALVRMVGLDTGGLTWIIFIAGGIIGILLVSFLFDWAIVTLASLAGASLVVGAFPFQRGTAGLIFTILFIIGIAIQGSVLRGEKNPKSTPE